MELLLHVWSLINLIRPTSSISFFSFIIFFLLFGLTTIFIRIKLCCNCEICHVYQKSIWSKEFDSLCDWYTHLLRKSPTGTIHIHVLNNIVTGNPQNVEHMLKTNFVNYPKGKQFSIPLGDLLGKGIFNADGESWKFQRKMASLELGSVTTRVFAYDVVKTEIQTRLIPLLSSLVSKSEAALDLQDVFQRFSFDTICKFSFGSDPGCLELSMPVSDFAVAFDEASKLLAQRFMASFPIIWKAKRFFNVGSEKKLKQSINVVNRLAKKLIVDRRDSSLTDKNDLLSRFMTTIEDDDDYLREVIISFLLAGRDTVASGLTTFFWLLMQNPSVKTKIREESDRVMNDPNQDVATFNQMREMHYLHATVYESLRLYPPVQMDSKYPLQDDVLPDGTIVKKGTRVTYHPYAMGRMETVWGSDCHEFKPERWLKNGIFQPESPFKFSVFQAGVRVCLGKDMAIMEMKCVALAIIRRFNFRVLGPGSIRLVPGLTASVHGGLPVLVEEE